MNAKDMITLPTGQQMPILGYGTWHAKAEVLEKALHDALEAGYRHIDTAPVYENEAIIGGVLKKWIDSGRLKREELFIVTKVPPTGNRPGGVAKWIKKSLNDLQLTYLDLYLVHTPFGFEETGDELHPVDENGNIKIDLNTNHIRVWAEMEQQVLAGRTKAIGVSNFNMTQINRILRYAQQPISNLQIELHTYFQQKELVAFCKSKGIIVTAYSPLGSRGFVRLIGKDKLIPNIMENDVVIEISKKHKKTPAQIALKFIIQKDIVAIPKSTNSARITENINIFDFKLDDEDIKALSALDHGATARICNFSFLQGIENHPEFPFEIPDKPQAILSN